MEQGNLALYRFIINQCIWCQALGSFMLKPWLAWVLLRVSQMRHIWDWIVSYFQQFWMPQTQLHGLLVQNLCCARTCVPKWVITWEIAAVSEQDFQYPSHLRCPYCLWDIFIGKAPTVSSNLPSKGLLFSTLIWLMGLYRSRSSDVCLICGRAFPSVVSVR